jgi:transposase
VSRRLAKKLAVVKPGTLYVGVDLALEHNFAMVIKERAEILTQFGFPNDCHGYGYFHRRLVSMQERHQAPAVLVGMEPTNYFWKLLAADLERRQIPYRLVNPYTVKKHREGDQLDRSKDDPRDAFTIADLLRTGKYTETRLLHGLYAELRQYASLHERLKRDVRRCKTLIRNTAGQLFPELASVFGDFAGLTALALFRSGAAAAAIRRMPLEQFVQSVRSEFQGQRLCVGKLRRAHQLATTSVGLRDGVRALQLALHLYIEQLQRLEGQTEQVGAALTNTFLELPESPYLLSVPGLGLVTGAIILAEIGDASHYSRAAQWVKLAGIQPVPNTSGRKTRSKTPMSHKGRSRLRTALFFTVIRLVRLDESFARSYRHYQQRKKNPLTKMQALGALMNKLLRILWALIKQRTFYNPAFDLPA